MKIFAASAVLVFSFFVSRPVTAQVVDPPLIVFNAATLCPTGTLEPIYGCHPPHPSQCGVERAYLLSENVGEVGPADGTLGLVQSETGEVWVTAAFVNFQPTEVFLHFSSDGTFPRTADGAPDLEAYRHHFAIATTINFLVDLQALGFGDSFDISMAVRGYEYDDFGEVVAWRTLWARGSGPDDTSIAFEAQTCGVNACVAATASAGYRTQTQGGWGSRANGDNPGTYRDAHFAAAFPGGLTVGCAQGNVNFSSSAAIQTFLPAGGPSVALHGASTNPNRRALPNTLAGQVTALSLSLGFDDLDAGFGASSGRLRNLVVQEGAFAGMRVGELSALAHDVLGGCRLDVSPLAVNEAVTRVNENFVDGAVDGGFLGCD